MEYTELQCTRLGLEYRPPSVYTTGSSQPSVSSPAAPDSPTTNHPAVQSTGPVFSGAFDVYHRRRRHPLSYPSSSPISLSASEAPATAGEGLGLRGAAEQVSVNRLCKGQKSVHLFKWLRSFKPFGTILLAPKPFISGLQHLNGVSVLPTLRTLLSHLKRYPILNKLLWLALESFGLATAWLSHQKTGIFLVLTLEWPVQACISFPVKSGKITFLMRRMLLRHWKDNDDRRE